MSAPEILDASRPEHAERWRTIWESWPEREVFAHPGYVSLEANGTTHRALAAVIQSRDGTVLYPFVLRRLEDQAWWSPDVGRAADITSPYGYGGPFVWGSGDRTILAAAFWSAFDAWAATEGIVAEFVRFSLGECEHLPYPTQRVYIQDNIVRSLEPELEDIWMDAAPKVRKNVKRAQRDGVEVIHDSGEGLDSFLEIYTETLSRRGAAQRYYFDRAYFDRLQSGLPGQFRYFHACLNGRVISSELVLVSAKRVYSFLGGTLADAFNHRPNDLLKFEIIRWAREHGKREFVLGGGFEPDDGIFKYKLAFAPNGASPFYVGRRILRSSTYDALVQNRIRGADSEAWITSSLNYFPRYRA